MNETELTDVGGKISEQQRREMLEAAKPLMKWMVENCNPHRKAVVDQVSVLLLEGIATGGTVRAALQGLAKAGALRVVLAVPVAPADTLESLWAEADEIVCLASPDPFYAVGLYYGDFSQTTDEEVVTLLEKARARTLQELNQ